MTWSRLSGSLQIDCHAYTGARGDGQVLSSDHDDKWQHHLTLARNDRPPSCTGHWLPDLYASSLLCHSNKVATLPKAYLRQLCLVCRLEPESKSMAADLKALIAEYEVAASPPHLPSITMPVKSESAQSSIPAEQPKQGNEPEAEPPMPHTVQQVNANASAEPAAANAEVRGQTLQHPVSETRPDELAPAAPIPAAVDSISKVNSSSKDVQRLHAKASPTSVDKDQQAGASLGTEQPSSTKAEQGKAAATTEAVSSQGSFLGKALSGASAKPRLPTDAQLSTSQAQQIADAAAAGTLPPQHSGSQSLNGIGQHHSRAAAAASNASEGLAARSLQPPKTSAHD